MILGIGNYRKEVQRGVWVVIFQEIVGKLLWLERRKWGKLVGDDSKEVIKGEILQIFVGFVLILVFI